jgi:hypothetical protein
LQVQFTLTKIYNSRQFRLLENCHMTHASARA